MGNVLTVSCTVGDVGDAIHKIVLVGAGDAADGIGDGCHHSIHGGIGIEESGIRRSR